MLEIQEIEAQVTEVPTSNAGTQAQDVPLTSNGSQQTELVQDATNTQELPTENHVAPALAHVNGDDEIVYIASKSVAETFSEVNIVQQTEVNEKSGDSMYQESREAIVVVPVVAPKLIQSNLEGWYQKPYMGGYKHKQTGGEYFHAATQTVTAQEKQAMVRVFHFALF